jgi:hypothetical protein
MAQYSDASIPLKRPKNEDDDKKITKRNQNKSNDDSSKDDSDPNAKIVSSDEEELEEPEFNLKEYLRLEEDDEEISESFDDSGDTEYSQDDESD